MVTALITIWIRPEPIPLYAFSATRSSFRAVIQFATHCVEMFTAVYAIPQPIYVNPHQIAFQLFGTSRFKNVRQLNSANIGAPHRIYGRKRPHLVWVFSAIAPNIGSLTASQIRAISMIAEIATGVSPTTSV